MPFPLSSLYPVTGLRFRWSDALSKSKNGSSVSSLFMPQVSRLALDPLKIIAMDDFTKVFMTANHLGIINNQKPQSITPLPQTCKHLVIGGLPFIFLN